MHDLCHRQLRQWLFVEESDKEETDAVIMSENGNLVRHTTIEMDVEAYLNKLNSECWEKLK